MIDRDCSERMQERTLRILRLIDMLAGYRFPKTVREINSRVCDMMQTRCSLRTTRRDLAILKSIALVRESAGGYTLDLNRSERLQQAAIVAFRDAI